MKGKVTNIRARINDEWLIVLADCESLDLPGEVREQEVLHIRLEDQDVRQFLCTAINWTERRALTGNILSVVLKTPIPRFSVHSSANLDVMRKINREYMAALAKYRRKASEIETLERQIDYALYKSYELDSNEIGLIEDMVGTGSTVLNLFPQPRGAV
jgi:hypothetical protein